jgi:ABC-type multidrug transport system fused ATPase/permease subunit
MLIARVCCVLHHAGTIKENVLNGKLDATFEDVVSACKTAHIHDFIMGLPEQYDTKVEEGSSNLSGGQKQRIASECVCLCNSLDQL